MKRLAQQGSSNSNGEQWQSTKMFKKYKLVVVPEDVQEGNGAKSGEEEQQHTNDGQQGELHLEGIQPSQRERAQLIYNAVKNKITLDRQAQVIYRAPPIIDGHAILLSLGRSRVNAIWSPRKFFPPDTIKACPL